MLNMPLYRIHKFVYDTEQSWWKMPQMPQCLCIQYWSFLHTELSYFTIYALCIGGEGGRPNCNIWLRATIMLAWGIPEKSI